MKSAQFNPSEPPESHGVPSGGSQSFDEIYDQNFDFVWRCLRGLGVPAAGLDDAAQDVFLVVHRQLASFRGDSAPRTWLFGIARRVASNHQRRSRRKQAPLEPLVMEPAHPGPSPLERVEDAEAASFVGSFLEGLDEKKRDVFILAVLEEMTIPEVAAALSIPLNTAYTRLRKVRAVFERALERHKS
ncbi:MAG TPA: sigma-70 family RNA polymerase sigma factor [Polyangia bacterium]|nr:sigma-70 family RNA polymerase sigma factor [Polyangia bacterium]